MPTSSDVSIQDLRNTANDVAIGMNDRWIIAESITQRTTWTRATNT